MALDIQIASTSINHTNFKIIKYLDMSADLSFTVVDLSGLHHYTNRMPVTVTDTIKGLIFAGYIDQPDEQNYYPQPGNKISIKCMDYREKALKRRPTYDYAGMLAGDIVVDMHANYLAAEGVLANYAYRRDTKQTQFATGTLSGTSATNNVGDGDLELSLAGSPLTTVTNTTAGWGTGTLNSVVAANNQLVLKSRNGIALSGDNNGNQGSNAYLYWQIWAGSYVIASSDALTYKVWINKNCPEIRAAMDFICTDGSTLRDFVVSGHHVRDQNDIDTHPKTDLKGFADDQWYYRYIDLTPMAGKTIATITIAFEGDAGGHYAAYFFDCQIVNGVSTPLTIYANNGVLNTSKRAFDLGYSNISVSTPLVYDTPGIRISNATSLTSVGIANTGVAAISETVPTGTSVEVDTSFDGGATWQPVTDRTAIAGLIAGASLSGISLTTRQVLTITGDDPTVTPAVSSLAANFTPSYSATKHDSFNQADTTAEWTNLGTNQGGVTITNQIVLANVHRNWDDASIASQTLYGSSTPFHGTSYKRLKISTNSGADVRSRMDFASIWFNFTLTVDVQVPDDATQSIGFTYRNKLWGNGNNTGGWVVDLFNNKLQLGYGDNTGGAGTGTYTNIATFNPASFAPASGTWHTLMVIVNVNNHQVWLDGVKYIDITNTTYNDPVQYTGYVAMHGYNNSGVGKAYYFDNFGIGNFLSGAYETNNISLNTLATVGDSFIAWQNEPLPAGCFILVQSTIDGGSTFQTCTNGAEIPLLTPGTNTVGKNLRILITLTAPSVAYTPILDGLVIWVTSNFSSSGTRVSPALSLSGVGRAGSTSLTWNDILPSGCTLGMDISPDGTTWTDVTANNGQPLPSALIFAQPDPYLDFFSADTSANYTSTFITGGSIESWTYDLTNNRLISTNSSILYVPRMFGGTLTLAGASGNNGVFRYDGFSRKDMFVEATLNYSDNAGLVVRMVDQSNLYACFIKDSVAGNICSLWKVVAGVFTQLGSDVLIVFPRNTYHVFRLDVQGTALKVYMDNVQIISQTDGSITAAGKSGIVAGNRGQFYSLRVQPYGDIVNSMSLYTRQRLASTNPQATPQVLDVTLSVRDPEIGNGALIPNTSYAYTKSVAQSYDDLASQSTSPHPYMVWIGDDLKLHFKHNQAQPAPFYLATANGNILWANNPPVVSRPDMNYRNHQIVDGGMDIATLPPITRKGDGFTQTWLMPGNLAQVPVITLDGQNQNIGIQGVDTGKDFYYQIGSNAVSQDPTEVPPGPNDTIVFSNLAIQTQVRVIADNVNGTGVYAGTIGQTQLAAIMGSTGITDTGIVEDYVSAPDLNLAAATALNTSLLQQFGRLGRDIPLSTNQWGLMPGMLVGVNIPQNGVINAFPLITKIMITAQPTSDVSNPNVIGGLLYRFDLETTEGPNVGDWSNLFTKLIAASAEAIR